MPELIELRPVKTTKPRRSHQRSYTLARADSSDNDSSSNDESPIVLNLQSKPSKASKRNNTIQTLPIIINTQAGKEKKKQHQKYIQQFVINTQAPSSSKKKEILFEPIIQPSLSPAIQYIPVSAPTTTFARVVEREPYAYQRAYTPALIDEYPFDYYSSYESPARRIVRTYPSNTRRVHLPRHAQRLVNRFISGMEHAHEDRVSDKSEKNFIFIVSSNLN